MQENCGVLLLSISRVCLCMPPAVEQHPFISPDPWPLDSRGKHSTETAMTRLCSCLRMRAEVKGCAWRNIQTFHRKSLQELEMSPVTCLLEPGQVLNNFFGGKMWVGSGSAAVGTAKRGFLPSCSGVQGPTPRIFQKSEFILEHLELHLLLFKGEVKHTDCHWWHYADTGEWQALMVNWSQCIHHTADSHFYLSRWISQSMIEMAVPDVQ